MIAKQLGMIPSWQINSSWPENPNYNNHVVFPPGMNQMTPQPQGPWYAPPGEAGLAGPLRSLRGLGSGFGAIDPKWYAVGGVTLLSIAVIIGAKAFLK